jgi:hypothetical protein
MSYLRYLLCLMFGSSLPPVVCRRAHVVFTLFVFACVWCFQHILYCGGGGWGGWGGCLRQVCPRFPVSLDCPFLIFSVFANVYLYTNLMKRYLVSTIKINKGPLLFFFLNMTYFI